MSQHLKLTTRRSRMSALGLIFLVAPMGCLGNLQSFLSSSDNGTTGGSTGGTSNNGTGSGGGTTAGATTAASPTTFIPLPQRMAVAKVKAILANGVPTADELKQVASDPTALRGLIAQWMTTPEYLNNRHEFFMEAFQQKPSIRTGELYLPNQLPPDDGTSHNMDESFARTVEYNIDAGNPFNLNAKTTTFMMTVPEMVYYAMVDTLNIFVIDDYTSELTSAADFTIEADLGPIPLSDSLNPASPNYMTWYDPSVVRGTGGCLDGNKRFHVNPSTAPAGERGQNMTEVMYFYLTNRPYQASYNGRCLFPGQHEPIFTAADYNTWKMVTIRQPQPGEATTNFWDIIKMRSMNTLVLKIPRVGFFTTPPFFAQYPTNASNQARSTTNQTLIIGLNHSFDGSTVATPGMDLSALEPSHALPGSACYGCHQTLDPMRQIFLHELGDGGYTPQTDSKVAALLGWFDYDGVSQRVNNLYGLGEVIADHPSFALAWAQKLCNSANSSPCSVTDPELQRVAQVFSASNLSWNVLVQELFSSPLITYASPTETAMTSGETVTIARQAQLCNNLSVRFKINDLCGLQPGTTVPTQLLSVQAVAAGLPANGYSRGQTVLPLVTTPGVVFGSSTENLCFHLAEYFVDNGASSFYSSKMAPAAIADLPITVMGLTPGSEAPMTAILQAHYNNALAAKQPPTVALQSTFMLACMSPSALAVGIGL